MTLTKPALLSSLLLAVACAPSAEGDLPFNGDASGLGKADTVGLEFTEVRAPIAHDRAQDGGKAIITSADSWVEYFGTDAPKDIDFDSEWVAFYGSGLKNTGGFGAQITGLSTVSGGGLVLATLDSSPGFDCFVTQALTTPHSIVKFAIPSPTPRWAVSDHESTVNRCGPTNEERLAELAESLKNWDAAKAEAGNSYSYTRVTSSFFANTVFTTTFVVDNGVVVERTETHGFGADVTEAFREVGADVGKNSGIHPVALIDDLYAQCKSDVLSLDEDDHFIDLRLEEGLLASCTSFDRLCQDDCSRGPQISNIDI